MNVSKRTILILSILAFFAAGSVLSGYIPVAAQSDDLEWSRPINLSNSGSATNPVMLADPNGQFHLFWQDTFAGYLYTRGFGIDWSDPSAVNVPFEGVIPQLMMDTEGYMHAFWISNRGNLIESRVYSESLPRVVSWTFPDRMAEDVVAFDVQIDSTGRFHLAYIQTGGTALNPAGIYYTQSNTRGTSWAPASVIDQSPYLRSITSQDANIHLKVSGSEESVYVNVAWDNPNRNRVFTVTSKDGGENWNSIIEVDSPSAITPTIRPKNINLAAAGEKVLLVWQKNLDETNCEKYYQWSLDGGETWQSSQQFLEGLSACSTENWIWMDDSGSAYLMTNVLDQSYLVAWDGLEWSDPRPQPPLTGFLDEETLVQVSFGCQQPILLNDQSLYIVGCDTGPGRDIWLLSRSLSDTESWFSTGPEWTSILTVTSGDREIIDPVMIADQNNTIHAFWSQAEISLPSDTGSSIYYSRMEGGLWSSPQAILSSPVGKADQPSAAMDDSGNIYLVWSGGESGEIFFSQANSARASVPTAWSEPLALPSVAVVGSHPDILIDPSGWIDVVFAVPLNEKRGIYFVRRDLSDETAVWSEPVVVFDAVASGWDMVDDPDLTVTGNGHLHILWVQKSTPNGVGPMGLYYARSEDGGMTWARPDLVIDKPTVWSKIEGYGANTVNRVWKEVGSGRTTFWHEQSLDSGSSWKRIAPVSLFGETIGQPTLISDPTGQLYLLQAVSRGDGRYALQHWLWDGSGWVTVQSLELENFTLSENNQVQAVTSVEDRLAIVFSGAVSVIASGQTDYGLFYSNRILDLPDAPVISTAEESESSPSPTATNTNELSLTPTVSPDDSQQILPTDQAAFPADIEGNSWMAPIVGSVSAGALVLVVLAAGIWISRNGRR